MNVVGSELSQQYRKHFIPLESNPEVFTELLHKLGVSPALEFQDVLSLDDPELLAFLPRPVLALILVFPTTSSYDNKVYEEDAERQPYSASHDDGDVVFFKQTINNACGLYAILHAICNSEARSELGTRTPEARDSIVGRLEHQCSRLGPDEVALLLETDIELERVYVELAQKGDTEAPGNAEDEVDYHYVCFVKSHEDGHLYQLDGDRKCPIQLGAVPANEDVLSDPCLRVIRGMIAQENENANFNLMALVPAGS
ncbi:hypothetical protein FB567DRAFT_458180 [Paraphoma chrysanthemicola]|uniref:Ubiquitin carboxyl-terminal hydrolase n=1 Tax=Paraphoma chrysanthemicola TaxID=798071 RepID=A0A8K0QRH4_9PLEO|nr:hypothetical protein FB567DRAFT_458180 [Paraphoma chrysanthemicola]